ncbi:hypothetical protein BU26DRAFT_45973 [Trematosphaeria pertusa]|uniref:Uncharacterized protein n=1 Tax=Trematosphaeria pertusa TaxID=390896 RepID=A0A6A6IAA0_9PLEO|nr:uncharacterized protein BU26DRAFT_45973 [Trematosphaeria pertusa]KAF2246460.1 hypothetical protein BU26DRAFT_45973 [Trematosphaeria pertusa]
MQGSSASAIVHLQRDQFQGGINVETKSKRNAADWRFQLSHQAYISFLVQMRHWKTLTIHCGFAAASTTTSRAGLGSFFFFRPRRKSADEQTFSLLCASEETLRKKSAHYSAQTMVVDQRRCIYSYKGKASPVERSALLPSKEHPRYLYSH